MFPSHLLGVFGSSGMCLGHLFKLEQHSVDALQCVWKWKSFEGQTRKTRPWYSGAPALNCKKQVGDGVTDPVCVRRARGRCSHSKVSCPARWKQRVHMEFLYFLYLNPEQIEHSLQHRERKQWNRRLDQSMSGLAFFQFIVTATLGGVQSMNPHLSERFQKRLQRQIKTTMGK